MKEVKRLNKCYACGEEALDWTVYCDKCFRKKQENKSIMTEMFVSGVIAMSILFTIIWILTDVIGVKL